MRVLSINTYGGSLLVGATALGVDIIGSYEDTGFGSDIQKANFPHLDFRTMRRDWPAQDLSEVFVIAHPPCSAFSVQNSNPEKRGTDSSAFACTKSVIEYAFANKALGLAIESVVGALAGAWSIHQYYADAFGYNLYRILENGSMWGAQWRDRFWVVYIKKGAAPDLMPWTLKPRWQNVAQVIEGHNTGPSPKGMDELLLKLQNRFITEAGCSIDELRQMFIPNPAEMCSIDDRLWKLKFPTRDRWDVCKTYVTKYASGAMVMLSPTGLAPVLLGGSWWYINGRNVSENAYKRLMGFPASYIFPEQGRYRQEMRTFLSKGVIPQIAEWVLEQSLTHLGWKRTTPKVENSEQTLFPDSQVEPYHIEILPDMIADFRIRKKTWGEIHPALRHEDEHGVARRPPATTGVAVPAPFVVPTDVPRVRQIPTPRATSQMPTMAKFAGQRVSKSPWNAPTIEDSLKETLFIRPHTADAYALHESHGYHRMGVKAGDVLLDLGAHIGCVASRAALVGAKQVISVEAEPENFALLEQNTHTFSNVELIYGAVWGGDSTHVNLNRVTKRNDGGHSTGTHSVLYRTHGDVIAVPRVDFPALVEKYKPDIIKCDIEGGEFSWSWKNLPAHVRAIGVELHTRRDTNRDRAKVIVNDLLEQGFTPVNKLNMESNFSAIIAYFARPTEAPAVVNGDVPPPVSEVVPEATPAPL